MITRSIAIAITATLSSAGCGAGPHLRELPITQRAWVANATCGQHLLETRFVADGHRWGEGVRVTTCGRLSGRFEVWYGPAADGTSMTETLFGDSAQDSRRCIAGSTEIAAATQARASGVSRGTDSSSDETNAATSGVAPAPVFRAATTADDGDCDHRESTLIELGRLPAGSPIRVVLFSPTPNDLAGARIRIVHSRLQPTVDDETWARHLDQQARERAARDREPEPVAQTARPPNDQLATLTVPTAPAARPDPSPPRPSTSAEWLPGYWHWTGRDWLWLRGQWRVPASDVVAGKTQRAPHAPPALRSENAARVDAAGVVWVPGYWAWDGRAYVWIDGAIQRVPSDATSWQPPTWRVDVNGAIFVPGAWR
jgi:hypothetical protein